MKLAVHVSEGSEELGIWFEGTDVVPGKQPVIWLSARQAGDDEWGSSVCVPGRSTGPSCQGYESLPLSNLILLARPGNYEFDAEAENFRLERLDLKAAIPPAAPARTARAVGHWADSPGFWFLLSLAILFGTLFFIRK